ncbi:MAG TPA: hypothetical protein PKO12_10120, partial [Holophaga sp.]|nr:hypothetical protein [Holophaga sp.]
MPIAALLEGQGTNLWEVVLHGGPVAKGVLVLLAGFSILSWVVIIQKVLLLNRSRKITDQFRAAFRRATDWRDLKQASGTYTLSPCPGLHRGTRIIIELKDDAHSYATKFTIERIIQQYSTFVPFPVKVEGKKVNTVQAIWTRSKSEITDEEYTEFYKFIGNA